MTLFRNISNLADLIPNGAHVAIPAEYSFVPMELIRGLIRQNSKDLNVLCVPIGGMAVDLLIGAGCIKQIEAAAVSLGENGIAPRFTNAVISKKIVMKDTTCPAIHTALQASEKGVPFMPLGGIIGSDIEANREDWKVVDDPLGKGNGPILLLPAIQPDFAIFHSPMADHIGNVWVGRRRELVTMAHAARQTLVTVERITDENLLANEKTAAGTIPALYIDAIAHFEGGAKPLGLTDCYECDNEAIAYYARQAKTDLGFNDYLTKVVYPSAKLVAQ